jgi:hypothetical protein
MELYCARLRCTFEGISFVISLEIYRKAWKKEFWRNLRGSKDPTLFVIIYEDGAAILGLFVAFCGVFLTNYFQLPS